MDFIEKKLSLDGVDLLTLLGSNDSNLKLVEDRLNGQIIVRGSNATIKGSQEDVENIEKVLKEMIYVVNTHGSLKISDIETILNLSYEGKEIISNADYNSIIFYTKNDAIKAKTQGQFEYLQTASKNDICFAIGPAGTGKTYLAVVLAVSALKKGIVNKIVLARPAVEAGESLGYLPGDFREKIDPYLRPLYDALEDLLPQDKLRGYLEKNQIEIVPLAYMRGRTLNNSFVILDEAQNATATQMKMFLTRLGVNSKAIITGDITQIDLPPKTTSGLIEAEEILKNVKGVGFVYFEKTDVVRHQLVKDIINAYEKRGRTENEK